jgi:hypothetical protein
VFASRKRRKIFAERASLPPREQLSEVRPSGCAADLASAEAIWRDIASSLGIAPDRLRADDELQTLVATDVFQGDRVLDIEARLKRLGIPSPPGGMTLAALVWQIAQAEAR